MSRLQVARLGFALASVLALGPARAETGASPAASLRIVAQVHEGSPRVPVNADTVLRRGDRIQVLVTLWQRAYVYVVHIASNGEAAVLLRSETAVPAGRTLRLPSGTAEQTYELDDRPGRETVAVLVSESALESSSSRLDTELRHVATHGRLPANSVLAEAAAGRYDGNALEHTLSRSAASTPKHDRTPGVLDLLGPTRGTKDKNGASLVYVGTEGVGLAMVQFEHGP